VGFKQVEEIKGTSEVNERGSNTALETVFDFFL
jgi:hypothetical protein